jgi:hypothetical protein
MLKNLRLCMDAVSSGSSGERVQAEEKFEFRGRVEDGTFSIVVQHREWIVFYPRLEDHVSGTNQDFLLLEIAKHCSGMGIGMQAPPPRCSASYGLEFWGL